MKKLTFTGFKEENKPYRMRHLDEYRAALNALPVGNYIHTIEKKHKKASRPQFKWLFGYIYPILLQGLLDAGIENCLTIDDVDSYCKALFANKPTINIQTGEIISIPMNKREFNTIDMMTYVDKIRQMALEFLNIDIPEPNTNFEISFEK